MESMDLSDLNGFSKFNDLNEIMGKLEEAQKDDGYDKISMEVRNNAYNGEKVLSIKSANPYGWEIKYTGEVKFDGPDRNNIELYVYLPDGPHPDENRTPVDYCTISNMFEEGNESFKDRAWKYFYSPYFTPSYRNSHHEITTDYDPIDYYKIKTNAYYNHYDGIENIMRTPRYAYCQDPADKEKYLSQVMRTDLGGDFIADIIDGKYDRTLESYDSLMSKDFNVPNLG